MESPIGARPGSAAHRLFVAAMIRGRPSGVRRRFCLAAFAGVGVAAAFGFRAAAQRFLCAAVADQPATTAGEGRRQIGQSTRYYWLMLAESHPTERLFGTLPVATGRRWAPRNQAARR